MDRLRFRGLSRCGWLVLPLLVSLAATLGVASASRIGRALQGTIAFDLSVSTGKPPGGWIEAASLDGSDRRTLTPPPQHGRVDTAESWSPKGGRLAFARAEAGSRSGLYVINRDGSGLRRLRSGDRAEGAVWSPDGSRIASWAPGNECQAPFGRVPPKLWITRADGRGSVALPAAPAQPGFDYGAGALAWSSDGRSLLYSIDRYPGGGECRLDNPTSTLYTVSVRGGNPRSRVVESDGYLPPGTILGAAWAPQGGSFAFLSLSGVYVVPLVGKQRQLASFSGVTLGTPYGLVWLRSNELVYTAPGVLAVANPATGRRRTLLEGQYLQLVGSSARTGKLAVADPDGHVTVASVEGGTRRRIVTSPGTVRHAQILGVAVHLS